MATHHILKDGTSYAVSGGSVLMDGTKYQIGGGRTLIDGTVYEIGFAKPNPVAITVLGGGIRAGWVTYNGTEITSGTITINAGDSVTVSCRSTGGKIGYIYLNETIAASGATIDYEYTPSENASSVSVEIEQRYSGGWSVSATIIEE